MSRQRKTAAVLRLLRGEDLETVSRELGVTAATLTGWHDAFLAGGEAALMTRAATGEELDRARPAEREDRPAGGRPPFCPRQAQAMSRVISPVTGKPYGLAAVCRVWQLARSGVYRHLSASPPLAAQRRGRLGAMSDEALTTAIRGVLAASPFHGEGHRKVWARLRHAGTRTSMRRVLRLMRQSNLLAPTRAGSPRGPRTHDGTIIPNTLDTMWGTDLTTTITGEGQAAVFVAVDHCSAECVGIHAHARATRFQALEPIRQGVRQHFGGFAKAIARGLAMRHDHGSQYMADHFQKELAFLGIESSPAFVRAPEGNGCAERFIRTLKENLLWVRTFETIEELRQALLTFRETYNNSWLIERHGFLSPAEYRRRRLQTLTQAA
jgi:transposase InsO family protein